MGREIKAGESLKEQKTLEDRSLKTGRQLKEDPSTKSHKKKIA